jgi:acetyl esterase/lipase
MGWGMAMAEAFGAVIVAAFYRLAPRDVDAAQALLVG